MQRTVIEQQLLPPSTDLYGVFIKALAAQVDGGWTIENFSSELSFAFCHRGSDRRIVGIEAEDPGRPSLSRPFPSMG